MTTYDGEKLKSIVESANKSANKLLMLYEGERLGMKRLRFLNFSYLALYPILK